MALIPPGSFIMGAPESEPGSFYLPSERPQHRVTFSKPFALGIYPVTFVEYDLFCVATGRVKPSDEDWGRGQRPVIHLSWDDANAYCAWLSALAGKQYRLPSDAEWEYACRAGSITAYWWGDTISTAQANYYYEISLLDKLLGKSESSKQTVPVENFAPNPFGLYQMHGNVWEWCADVWHSTYDGAPTHGSAWLIDGIVDRRIGRGGALNLKSDWARSAYRLASSTTFHYSFFGFRLVQA
ncbi:MAG: formylglycine-generating enzyme family protein [Candidatus Methylumidiphilus sp.]